MSKRHGRSLLGLIVVAAALALLPATALAAHEAVTVTPADLTAGGSPALQLSAGFDKTKTLTSADFNLPPGLLLNLGSANSSCLTGTPDFSNDAACDVGTGEIDLTAEVSLTGGAPSPISGVTATGDIFLAPPAAGTNDLAVLDVHITKVVAPIVGEQDQVIDAPIHVTLNPDGSLSLNASNLPTSITSPTLGTVGLQITGMTASFTGTTTNAAGTSNPFIRLPTSCGAATSTLAATYSDGSTGTGSDSFTPTDCASLPYAPQSPIVQVTTDASDNVSGVELQFGEPQSGNDAADKSVTLSLPPSVKPNFAALSPGDQIGNLGVESSFLPFNNSFLNQPVTLGGTTAAPTLVATLAPGLTVNGKVDPAADTVTFSDLPDITANYTFRFTAANGTPSFTTDCSGGNVTSVSIAGGNQIASGLSPVFFTGCTPPPLTLATAESMTVTPSDPTAGGSPALSTDLVFNSNKSASGVEVDLAPGLLSDIAADSSCLTGAPQFTTTCHIGTEVDTTFNGLFGSANQGLAGDAFLVAPPASKDIAGINIHLPSNAAGTDTVWGVSVDPSTGGLVLDDPSIPTSASLGSTSIPTPKDEIDLVFDAGSISQLPTGCGPAKSSFTVTYTDANGDNTTANASGSFTPTGCANEPYAPTLSASVIGTGGPGAAEVKLDSTQKADEAADQQLKLSFPSSLKLGSGSGQVGTASVTTPLSPKPLSAPVTDQGGKLSVTFPTPFGLTLTGAVDQANDTITFSGLPDVRFSDLSLDLKGLFQTDCTAGSVGGAFAGQGGQSHTATAAVKFSDCTPPSTSTPPPPGNGSKPPTTQPKPNPQPQPQPNPKPKVNKAPGGGKAKGSGTVKGLASGHPTVSFRVTLPAGQKAKSVTVALPKGLKFSKAAFAKHKVSGLKLGGGAKAASVKLNAGKLVIALKKPVHSLSIKASGKLVTASGAVAAGKHHKPLTLTVRATTTNHRTDTVRVSLKS